MLTQIHPALDRVFAGVILSRTLVLDLLIHYGGPTKLAAAGRGRVLKWMRNRAKKDTAALVDAIFAALAEQTVTVPGTAAAELVIPQLAANIKALQAQRDTIAGQVEEMLESFPLAQVLMSMPRTWPLTPASRRSPGGRVRRSAESFPPGPAINS